MNEVGGDCDLAIAVAERLGGVDHQVHDDLPQLGRVRHDGGKGGVQIEVELGAFADRGLQERHGGLDQGAEFDWLDHKATFAGVGEHLLAKLGSAVGGNLDLFEVVLDRRLRRDRP
jgi:hypothetical protein